MQIAEQLRASARTATNFQKLSEYFRSPEEERQFKKLRKSLEYLSKEEVREVEKAFLVGCEAHKGQTRISGGKYITHPLEVAQLLADVHLDQGSIVAGILHDTLEDTSLSGDDLQREFGEDVRRLVEGVSKIDNIKFKTPEQAEAANLSRMLLAMADDVRVILIKLADRIHNMRSVNVHRLDKRKRIATQTLDIYAPIANWLGMENWQRELEDLCFRTLHPNRYTVLARGVKRQAMKVQTVKKLVKDMKALLEENDIVADVSGRQKNLYGIYQKMQRTDQRLESVKDINAFRIIVDSASECYLALGVIHKRYKPIPGEFTDYIAVPKFNGYQSLHTKVFGEQSRYLEVQIRTKVMHQIAETGIASHLKYKHSDSATGQYNGLETQWLKDVIESSDTSDNPHEHIDHIRMSMYPDHVYVCTPRGDIKRLPKGATVIDFAYAVHSDVGRQAASATVNNQPASLHTPLENGDSVTVKTSRYSSPEADWLNFAKSVKARAAINNYLKKQTRTNSVSMGEKLLKNSLKNMNVRYDLITEEQKSEVVKQLQASSWEDILFDLGIGNRIAAVTARQFVPDDSGGSKEYVDSELMVISGTEGLAVSYAKCCHPIPGDSIVGHLTTGRGIVIHIDGCVQTREAKDNLSRWHKFNWHTELAGKFPVAIRLDAQNKEGVLATIARSIADQGGNISDCKFNSQGKDVVTMDIVIEVSDRDHLARIMRQIKKNEPVLHLNRLRTTKSRSHAARIA